MALKKQKVNLELKGIQTKSDDVISTPGNLVRAENVSYSKIGTIQKASRLFKFVLSTFSNFTFSYLLPTNPLVSTLFKPLRIFSYKKEILTAFLGNFNTNSFFTKVLTFVNEKKIIGFGSAPITRIEEYGNLKFDKITNEDVQKIKRIDSVTEHLNLTPKIEDSTNVFVCVSLNPNNSYLKDNQFSKLKPYMISFKTEDGSNVFSFRESLSTERISKLNKNCINYSFDVKTNKISNTEYGIVVSVRYNETPSSLKKSVLETLFFVYDEQSKTVFYISKNTRLLQNVIDYKNVNVELENYINHHIETVFLNTIRVQTPTSGIKAYFVNSYFDSIINDGELLLREKQERHWFTKTGLNWTINSSLLNEVNILTKEVEEGGEYFTWKDLKNIQKTICIDLAPRIFSIFRLKNSLVNLSNSWDYNETSVPLINQRDPFFTQSGQTDEERKYSFFIEVEKFCYENDIFESSLLFYEKIKPENILDINKLSNKDITEDKTVINAQIFSNGLSNERGLILTLGSFNVADFESNEDPPKTLFREFSSDNNYNSEKNTIVFLKFNDSYEEEEFVPVLRSNISRINTIQTLQGLTVATNIIKPVLNIGFFETSILINFIAHKSLKNQSTFFLLEIPDYLDQNFNEIQNRDLIKAKIVKTILKKEAAVLSPRTGSFSFKANDNIFLLPIINYYNFNYIKNINYDFFFNLDKEYVFLPKRNYIKESYPYNPQDNFNLQDRNEDEEGFFNVVYKIERSLRFLESLEINNWTLFNSNLKYDGDSIENSCFEDAPSFLSTSGITSPVLEITNLLDTWPANFTEFNSGSQFRYDLSANSNNYIETSLDPENSNYVYELYRDTTLYDFADHTFIAGTNKMRVRVPSNKITFFNSGFLINQKLRVEIMSDENIAPPSIFTTLFPPGIAGGSSGYLRTSPCVLKYKSLPVYNREGMFTRGPFLSKELICQKIERVGEIEDDEGFVEHIIYLQDAETGKDVSFNPTGNIVGMGRYHIGYVQFLPDGAFYEAGKNYGIKALFSYVDNSNNKITSEVSEPLLFSPKEKKYFKEFNSGIAEYWDTIENHDTITLNISNPIITKEKPGVNVEIYRTMANDTEGNYFLANTTKINENDSSFHRIKITGTDLDIQNKKTLFTNSGELENIWPDSLFSFCQKDSSIYALGESYRNRVYYSKPLREGEAVNFSPFLYKELTLKNSKPLRIESFDDKIIVFYNDRITYFAGTGANALGSGESFSEEIEISGENGLLEIAPEIKKTMFGIFFFSEKGLYLIDKGLKTKYIGSPIEDYFSYSPKKEEDATILPNYKIESSEETNSIYVLIKGFLFQYNYEFDKFTKITKRQQNTSVPGIPLINNSREKDDKFRDAVFLDIKRTYNKEVKNANNQSIVPSNLTIIKNTTELLDGSYLFFQKEKENLDYNKTQDIVLERFDEDFLNIESNWIRFNGIENMQRVYNMVVEYSLNIDLEEITSETQDFAIEAFFWYDNSIQVEDSFGSYPNQSALFVVNLEEEKLKKSNEIQFNLDRQKLRSLKFKLRLRPLTNSSNFKNKNIFAKVEIKNIYFTVGAEKAKNVYQRST